MPKYWRIVPLFFDTYLSMKEYRNAFQLLSAYRSVIMGFAALWIFVFHLSLRLPSTSSLFFIKFIQRIGFCGVDIFFFLSGYGCIFAIERHSLLSFYNRRVKRLLFPYLIIAITRASFENWSIDTFLRNIFGINFYLRNIYSFLWFVPAICTLYVIFPFYFKVIHRLSRPERGIYLTIIILFFLLIFFRSSLRNDLYGFTNRIIVFLCGNCCGIINDKSTFNFDSISWIICCSCFFVGLYLSYITLYQNVYLIVPVGEAFLPTLLMSISLSFLLAGTFEILEQYRAGQLLSRLLTFYGNISFELYTLQEWIIKRILFHFGRRLAIGTTTLKCLLILVVTIASYIESVVVQHFLTAIGKVSQLTMKISHR